ncbi:MAG TPA: hypothetical protein VIU12_28825 [Chryseolinea sp.]
MTKQLLHTLATICVFMACSGQQDTQIDLEAMKFDENIYELAKGREVLEEDMSIGTTLSSTYLYNSNLFRFGPINGREDNDVFFLRNQNNRKKIEGFVLLMEQTDQYLEIYHYFKGKYGNPKVVTPLPSFDRDGMQSSLTAFLWHVGKNRLALLSGYYKYSSALEIKTIPAYLYVIDKQAKDIYDQPLIDRLLKGYD